MITVRTVDDSVNTVRRKVEGMYRNSAVTTRSQVWQLQQARTLDAMDTSRFVFSSKDKARVDLTVNGAVRCTSAVVRLTVNGCQYRVLGYTVGDAFVFGYTISVTLTDSVNIAQLVIEQAEGMQLLNLCFRVQGTNLTDTPTLVGCVSGVYMEGHVNELRMRNSSDVLAEFDAPIDTLTCAACNDTVYAFVTAGNNLYCYNTATQQTTLLMDSVTDFACCKEIYGQPLYAVSRGRLLRAVCGAEAEDCSFDALVLDKGKTDGVVCSDSVNGQHLVALQTACGYRVYRYADGEYAYCGLIEGDLVAIRREENDNIVFIRKNGGIVMSYTDDTINLTQSFDVGHWDDADIDSNGNVFYSVGRSVNTTMI